MLVLEVFYFLSLHSRQFRHIAPFFSIYFFFHSVFMHIKRSNYVWKRLLWNLHLHSNVAYKMTESMLCIRWEIIMISMSFLMRTELTARIHLHGHIWVVIWCHTIQSNYKNIHKIIPMPYWNAVRNAIISAKTVDFAHTHTQLHTYKIAHRNYHHSFNDKRKLNRWIMQRTAYLQFLIEIEIIINNEKKEYRFESNRQNELLEWWA